MQTFTGWQYLLIDAANQYGHDKLTYDQRIEWANYHLNQLEWLAEGKQWKEKPLYLKAVMAIRKAQQGKPTGHLVGFDAICSGMQIMSAITGCESGARATGLIDTGSRPDAYTSITATMNQLLAAEGITVNISRNDAKQATMTAFYGSVETPKAIFGEDTPELQAFHQAMMDVAPGATVLLNELLGTWNPSTLSHDWKLPDGYEAKVKVMQKVEKRIEVDELDHATFTYEYYENAPSDFGLANAANVVHSIDAYILRSVERRCNYDVELLEWAEHWLEAELLERAMGTEQEYELPVTEMGEYLQERYRATGMADLYILQFIQEVDLRVLDTEHLKGLKRIVNQCLEHKPFPVVTVHDEFKCHPNNMNHLRQHYANILAELSESRILDDILGTLLGVQGQYQKLGNIGSQIRQANYSLS